MLATFKYLVREREAVPYQISPPSGQGIDHNYIKETIESFYGGREPDFVRSGPDIVAVSEKEWWRVECKGIKENNKTQTHRNNFDRALASVVSYYEDRPDIPPEWNGWAKDGVFLGLALPASEHYLKQLKRC